MQGPGPVRSVASGIGFLAEANFRIRCWRPRVDAQDMLRVCTRCVLQEDGPWFPRSQKIYGFFSTTRLYFWRKLILELLLLKSALA